MIHQEPVPLRPRYQPSAPPAHPGGPRPRGAAAGAAFDRHLLDRLPVVRLARPQRRLANPDTDQGVAGAGGHHRRRHPDLVEPVARRPPLAARHDPDGRSRRRAARTMARLGSPSREPGADRGRPRARVDARAGGIPVVAGLPDVPPRRRLRDCRPALRQRHRRLRLRSAVLPVVVRMDVPAVRGDPAGRRRRALPQRRHLHAGPAAPGVAGGEGPPVRDPRPAGVAQGGRLLARHVGPALLDPGSGGRRHLHRRQRPAPGPPAAHPHLDRGRRRSCW